MHGRWHVHGAIGTRPQRQPHRAGSEQHGQREIADRTLRDARRPLPSRDEALQLRLELRDVGVAIRRQRRHCPGEDGAQFLRQHHVARGIHRPLPRPRAGEQFMQHHAQREDVAAHVDGLATQQLGARVFRRQCTAEGARHRAPVRHLFLQQPGHAEIQQSHFALLGHQDVRGLEVAVDHLPRMRMAHRIEHAQEDAHALDHGEIARIAPGRQHLAAHILHREVRHATGIDARVVQPRDAGILQPREDVALMREARRHLHAHLVHARYLQRHLPVEGAIGTARQPHLGHAARAQQALQLIGPHALARLAAAGAGLIRGGIGERHARQVLHALAQRGNGVIRQQYAAQRLHQWLVAHRQGFDPATPGGRRQRQRLVEQLAQSRHL
jgi:hypothetical protein